MTVKVLIFGVGFGIFIFVVGMILMSASADTVAVYQPIVCPEGDLRPSTGSVIRDDGYYEDSTNIYCYLKDDVYYEASGQILLLVCAASFAPAFLAVLMAFAAWRFRPKAI